MVRLVDSPQSLGPLPQRTLGDSKHHQTHAERETQRSPFAAFFFSVIMVVTFGGHCQAHCGSEKDARKKAAFFGVPIPVSCFEHLLASLGPLFRSSYGKMVVYKRMN